jgi:hypothetical protein
MFVCNCNFGFYVFKQPEDDHVMAENVATHLHNTTKSDPLIPTLHFMQHNGKSKIQKKTNKSGLLHGKMS